MVLNYLCVYRMIVLTLSFYVITLHVVDAQIQPSVASVLGNAGKKKIHHPSPEILRNLHQPVNLGDYDYLLL